MRVRMTVNGVPYEDEVEPRLLLVQYIRNTLGLTGTNVGCDTTSCGACTVLLDGESVKSCTVLAVQADEAHVTTIDGQSGVGIAWTDSTSRYEWIFDPATLQYVGERNFDMSSGKPVVNGNAAVLQRAFVAKAGQLP